MNQWGVIGELLLPDASEDAEALEAVWPTDTPKRYVQRVTQFKLQAALARRVRRGLAPAPVLCADTTVALGRAILGKPENAEHAVDMLTALAGRTHRVLTAVAVGWLSEPNVASDGTSPDGLAASASSTALAVSESRVTFAPLTPAQIRRYVDSGEPLGKAGAYAIQGQASLWISSIAGSYSGIMGLPAFETAQVLRQAGLNLY